MTTDGQWSVGIVIPARDEEAVIGDCLRSVMRAIEFAQIDGWVVVVADRCRDDTGDLARRILGAAGEVRAVDDGAVGAARRAGCERALDHFSSRPARGVWLLSTDADSTVPHDWIAVHCAEASRGAAAVAGTVTVTSYRGRAPHLRRLYERRYAVRVAGEHLHLHGTNLGFRADAYTAAGGWRPLVTGEDHDLWTRLRESGYPVVFTTLAPVTTSSRRRGRAPSGFAAYLNALELAPEAIAPS